MIVEKAHIILLEKERKGEKLKFPKEEERAIFATAAVRGKADKPPYKTYERLHRPVC